MKLLTIVSLLTLGVSAQYFVEEHISSHHLWSKMMDGVTPPSVSDEEGLAVRNLHSRRRVSDSDRTFQVFGFHPYWRGEDWKKYPWDLMTIVAWFGIDSDVNGELHNFNGWPEVATPMAKAAQAEGVKALLTCTLFSEEGIQTLVSNDTAIATLTENLVREVEDNGFDGVNIDFEGAGSASRDGLVKLMGSIHDAFHAINPDHLVTMAIPPVDWSSAYDYGNLQSVTDFIFLMGYDYAWTGSENAGPVAPLVSGYRNVEWSVQDYVEKTSGNNGSLVMGVPWYGYEWETKTNDSRAETVDNTGVSFGFADLMEKKEQYGFMRDEASGSPWYRFQTDEGKWRVGWFEDKVSLLAKYEYAKAQNLGGIGIWALGFDGDRPEMWDAVRACLGVTEETAETNTETNEEANEDTNNEGNDVAVSDGLDSDASQEIIVNTPDNGASGGGVSLWATIAAVVTGFWSQSE